MNKSALNFLAIVLITPFLLQCALKSDVEKLQYQLRVVNKKLENIKSTAVDPLQRRQARASNQVDLLEQNILKLNSQLEEIYLLHQRLQKENGELKINISTVAQKEAIKRREAIQHLREQQRAKEAKLTAELDKRLTYQQKTIKAIQEARIKEAEHRVQQAALSTALTQNGPIPAKTTAQSSSPIRHIRQEQKKIINNKVQTIVKPKDPISRQTQQISAGQTQVKAPVVPEISATTPTGDMQRAQRLFDKNNFSKALELFEKVANSSTGNDGVNANFMMGECFFNQKQYDRAIMQYQKIISQHADHPKAPPSMLQQAFAFERLADKGTAKVIYKKILKKYPTSSEAIIAKEKLAKL